MQACGRQPFLKQIVFMAFCLFLSFPESPVRAQQATASKPGTAHVLIVVGPSTHAPGTHEVLAGGRLIKYCCEQLNLEGVKVEATLSEGWPRDKELLAKIDTVVFTGDRFPLAELKDKQGMQQLSQMMQSGCGIVCFHYATGLNASQVPEDGDHPLLNWMGGYFATKCKHHQSIARIFREAEIKPAAVKHPVLRGVVPFKIYDEPYINNYFGPNGMAGNVTALATSMLPPENPKKEVVAWATERQDGGRGMGVVMPHFYQNWEVEPLRKLILNAVVWTAKEEVPKQGVQVQLHGLAKFEPERVEMPERFKVPKK